MISSLDMFVYGLVRGTCLFILWFVGYVCLWISSWDMFVLFLMRGSATIPIKSVGLPKKQ